jgi:ABC-type antimicrobial peptide transport system permease subunit
MLFEHLVIGIIGGVVGAVASIAAAEWMGAAFSNWAFTMSFPVQWDIVVMTAVGVIVASVAVVPFGIFRVRGMDLVEKTKEFSH